MCKQISVNSFQWNLIYRKVARQNLMCSTLRTISSSALLTYLRSFHLPRNVSPTNLGHLHILLRGNSTQKNFIFYLEAFLIHLNEASHGLKMKKCKEWGLERDHSGCLACGQPGSNSWHHIRSLNTVWSDPWAEPGEGHEHSQIWPKTKGARQL